MGSHHATFGGAKVIPFNKAGRSGASLADKAH
jgi:hypothetical protein